MVLRLLGLILLACIMGCSAADAERPLEPTSGAADETNGSQSAPNSTSVPEMNDGTNPAGSTAALPSAGQSGENADQSSVSALSDDDLRRRVIGTWQDHYQGKRTMVLRDDGTGQMVVELSGMTATLFASRLEFDMVWSVENGRLNKRTVGGRPEMRVNMILKMMGDRVSEPILELTESRLLLLDADGKTRYDWQAVR